MNCGKYEEFVKKEYKKKENPAKIEALGKS